MRPQKQKSYHQRKHFKKNFRHKKKELSFDQMLRQFKKKCERAGIIQECKKREFYEKPSAKRQRKKAEAIKRQRLADRKNSLPNRPRWS
tara:strand:- start:2982 stop:3248 length:267 start_codon:yes stop_codon:yes gene_type:complete